MSGTDKLSGVSWHQSAAGAPEIDGVCRYLDCKLEQEVPAGDHTIAIFRVLNLEVADKDASPLLFHRGKYVTVARAPVEVD